MSENENRTPAVKAADLMEAFRDPRALAVQRPESRKPKTLIESMRVSGQSRLQSSDTRLYEALLVAARKQGLDRETYEIALGDAAGFLGEPNLDRVRESVKRLGATFVSYDYVDGQEVRRWGSLRLLGYQGVDNLRTGTSKLVYWLEPPVRKELAEAKSYTLLDLYEVSRFRSRYGVRLYELLNLRAGYDDGFRRPWIVAPKELAELLGYAPKTLNYAIFKRDVLDPAMADLEQAVSRFEAAYEEKREGRGRGGGKAVALTFSVTASTRKTEGMQAARVSSYVYEQAYLARESGDADMPSSVAVGRAVTAHGQSDMVLWSRWHDAVEAAKSSAPGEAVDGIEASLLLGVLRTDGADAAFVFWADAVFGKPRAPAFIRDEPEPRQPAPVKDSAPEPKPAPAMSGAPPKQEDFGSFIEYEAACHAWLERRRAQKPVDARSQREKDEDHVRATARDIVDVLDGFKPGTGRSVRLDPDKPGEFVDLGWVSRMCHPAYGWETMDGEHMTAGSRKAFAAISAALKALRRLPMTAQGDADRRGPLRAIAEAVAEWKLERAVVAANVAVAKAPKPASEIIRVPPPPRRAGWQPVTEAHADNGYGGYYGNLAEAEPDYAGDPLDD